MIVFVLVLVPKKWSHSHGSDSHDSKKQNTNTGLSFQDDDCSYCDFDLSKVVLAAEIQDFHFDNTVYSPFKGELLEKEKEHQLLFSLRGPPMI